jgi:hypothetical protein
MRITASNCHLTAGELAVNDAAHGVALTFPARRSRAGDAGGSATGRVPAADVWMRSNKRPSRG